MDGSNFQPGDRIETTGRGVTATWGRVYMGTVIRATKRAVFVRWDGCAFEDERAPEEVRRVAAEALKRVRINTDRHG